MTTSIDFRAFRALHGLALCHYMEPILSDPLARVSKEVIDQMRWELTTYDEYHLVYALTLGAKFSPETFASALPPYLAHKEQSVCCAAINALENLPGAYVTRDLIESLRGVQSSHPQKPWIGEVIRKLEIRLSEP